MFFIRPARRKRNLTMNFTKICQKSFLYTKWNTIICETSTKMTIFNSNGSFYDFIQICPKFPLYTKLANIKPIVETSTFYVPKLEFYKWNWPFCNFTQINQKIPFNFKISKFKISKMIKIKIHILEIS